MPSTSLTNLSSSSGIAASHKRKNVQPTCEAGEAKALKIMEDDEEDKKKNKRYKQKRNNASSLDLNRSPKRPRMEEAMPERAFQNIPKEQIHPTIQNQVLNRERQPERKQPIPSNKRLPSPSRMQFHPISPYQAKQNAETQQNPLKIYRQPRKSERKVNRGLLHVSQGQIPTTLYIRKLEACLKMYKIVNSSESRITPTIFLKRNLSYLQRHFSQKTIKETITGADLPLLVHEIPVKKKNMKTKEQKICYLNAIVVNIFTLKEEYKRLNQVIFNQRRQLLSIEKPNNPGGWDSRNVFAKANYYSIKKNTEPDIILKHLKLENTKKFSFSVGQLTKASMMTGLANAYRYFCQKVTQYNLKLAYQFNWRWEEFQQYHVPTIPVAFSCPDNIPKEAFKFRDSMSFLTLNAPKITGTRRYCWTNFYFTFWNPRDNCFTVPQRMFYKSMIPMWINGKNRITIEIALLFAFYTEAYLLLEVGIMKPDTPAAAKLREKIMTSDEKKDLQRLKKRNEDYPSFKQENVKSQLYGILQIGSREKGMFTGHKTINLIDENDLIEQDFDKNNFLTELFAKTNELKSQPSNSVPQVEMEFLHRTLDQIHESDSDSEDYDENDDFKKLDHLIKTRLQQEEQDKNVARDISAKKRSATHLRVYKDDPPIYDTYTGKYKCDSSGKYMNHRQMVKQLTESKRLITNRERLKIVNAMMPLSFDCKRIKYRFLLHNDKPNGNKKFRQVQKEALSFVEEKRTNPEKYKLIEESKRRKNMTAATRLFKISDHTTEQAEEALMDGQFSSQAIEVEEDFRRENVQIPKPIATNMPTCSNVAGTSQQMEFDVRDHLSLEEAELSLEEIQNAERYRMRFKKRKRKALKLLNNMMNDTKQNEAEKGKNKDERRRRNEEKRDKIMRNLIKEEKEKKSLEQIILRFKMLDVDTEKEEKLRRIALLQERKAQYQMLTEEQKTEWKLMRKSQRRALKKTEKDRKKAGISKEKQPKMAKTPEEKKTLKNTKKLEEQRSSLEAEEKSEKKREKSVDKAKEVENSRISKEKNEEEKDPKIAFKETIYDFNGDRPPLPKVPVVNPSDKRKLTWTTMIEEEPERCILCRRRFPTLYHLMLHYNTSYPRLTFIFAIQNRNFEEDPEESSDFERDGTAVWIDVMLNPAYTESMEIIPPTKKKEDGVAEKPVRRPRTTIELLTKVDVHLLRRSMRMDNTIFTRIFHILEFVTERFSYSTRYWDITCRIPITFGVPGTSCDMLGIPNPGWKDVCALTDAILQDYVDIDEMSINYFCAWNKLCFNIGRYNQLRLGSYMIHRLFLKYFGGHVRNEDFWMETFMTQLIEYMDHGVLSGSEVYDLTCRLYDKDYNPLTDKHSNVYRGLLKFACKKHKSFKNAKKRAAKGRAMGAPRKELAFPEIFWTDPRKSKKEYRDNLVKELFYNPAIVGPLDKRRLLMADPVSLLHGDPVRNAKVLSNIEYDDPYLGEDDTIVYTAEDLEGSEDLA